MPIFIITEDNKFLTTNDGVFLIVDPLVFADVRRTFIVLPRVTQFKLIRDDNMSLRISPREKIDDMDTGEDYAYELDLTGELKTKTVASYTFNIYDSSDVIVTDSLGGGSFRDGAILTFGIKAVSEGKYVLKFIITCNELLPDETTNYKFNIEMDVTIN